MRQAIELLSIFTTVFVFQIPVLIVFNAFKKNKLLTHIRFIAITAYVVVIIHLTMWPPITGQSPVGWSGIAYNFKPFDSIIGSLSHPYYLVGVRNVFGNFVLLLPLAFLTSLKGPMRNLGLGFCVSLSIEVVQAMLSISGIIMSRSLDVDDLILNTFGFFAGYLIRAITTSQLVKINQSLKRNQRV